MSIQNRFLAYVDAFEITYKDNDWSRLEQYFTKDAVYDGGPGEAAHGRPAVMAKLETAIDGFDRLMDSRVVEFLAPVTEGETVSIYWTARYSKAGLPDLHFGGYEYATFEGDCISHLRDELDPGAEKAMASWMDQHGQSLFAQ